MIFRTRTSGRLPGPTRKNFMAFGLTPSGVEPLTERLNPNKLKLYPVNISIEKLDPRGFRKFFGVSE
jgi:hypothetical protein